MISRMGVCSGHLKEVAELGSRENCFGLFQSIDLLVTGSLADLEIFHDEITALMQLGVVVGELLQLQKHVLLCLVGFCQVLLGLCLFFRLVHHFLGLGLNGRVGFLNKILVCLLGILLRADGVSLHGLGIIDDLLDHAHDTASCCVLLVLLESWWRRWASRLLLQKCCLLLVEALQDVEGFYEKKAA